SSSKYTKRLETIIKPSPNLRYVEPIDYPLNERKTDPYIDGVSAIINTSTNNYKKGDNTSLIKQYLQDFPVKNTVTSTLNANIDKNEHHAPAFSTHLRQIQKELENWNPHKDQFTKGTDPYKTIFVGRLPYSVDEVELHKIFIKFGAIEKLRIVRDIKTNKSKGYGFITFGEQQSAKNCYKSIGTHAGMIIDGRPIIVDVERGRTVKYFRPRRLGGGLGGRGYMKRYLETKQISEKELNSNGNKGLGNILKHKHSNSSTTQNINNNKKVRSNKNFNKAKNDGK
ncbi:U1 snRNP complex subunit SNP1 SCDLUD_000338, partial [Saccharomycodes ludwigii]|uniref:U1 snRNP complex subunit SNP1 n=1 Tax=Saccharomycodes ludwigii TaxID=36035 RepID=UPI001E8C5A96